MKLLCGKWQGITAESRIITRGAYQFTNAAITDKNNVCRFKKLQKKDFKLFLRYLLWNLLEFFVSRKRLYVYAFTWNWNFKHKVENSLRKHWQTSINEYGPVGKEKIETIKDSRFDFTENFFI